jgi:hypothetical protein
MGRYILFLPLNLAYKNLNGDRSVRNYLPGIENRERNLPGYRAFSCFLQTIPPQTILKRLVIFSEINDDIIDSTSNTFYHF